MLLGFKTKATFNILNDGHDNLELRYSPPPLLRTDRPSWRSPSGGHDRHRKGVPPCGDLNVLMTSPCPLPGNIEFLDEDGQRYTIAVTGDGGQLVITAYDFLKANEQVRELALTDNKGRVVEASAVEKCAANVNPAQRGLRPAERDSDGRGRHLPSAHISKFLGSTDPKGVFGQDICGDLISTKGRGIIDLIETLSGKQVPGKITKLSSNRKEQAQQYLNQYEKVLTMLRSYGACLCLVKLSFCRTRGFQEDRGLQEVSGSSART